MVVIKSKQNPAVRELAALKDKKGRQERGTFLVEGGKMVSECAACGMEIVRIAVREGYAGKTFSSPAVTLGEDAFNAICDEKTPQGVAAEVKIPQYALKPPERSCLLLDGVADPANVGAIVRTAAAAGYEEIYLAGCADPYSPKSVRASMSGVFRCRLMRGAREEILRTLEEVPMIAADMDGKNVFECVPPEKFCLCIGNEGSGLSDEVRARADFTVAIPMEGAVESLNAAVSAGILMYQLKKNKEKGI